MKKTKGPLWTTAETRLLRRRWGLVEIDKIATELYKLTGYKRSYLSLKNKAHKMGLTFRLDGCWTAKEAAEALGVNYAKLTRLIREGQIPVHRIGRSVWVSPDDGDKILALLDNAPAGHITAKEAASRLGYNYDHTTALLRDKVIRGVPINRRWYVDESHLLAIAQLLKDTGRLNLAHDVVRGLM